MLFTLVHARPGATTPPMGFNTWNRFKCSYNETTIMQTADELVNLGLAQLGYTYVNLDDCWLLPERDPTTKRMVPDPKKFPSGMKHLADYIHSKGLKFGIYSDSGTNTCVGLPGSRGFEEIDAETWAEWTVDYLKYDNCYTPEDEPAIVRYKAMGDALKNAGRPIFFSLCSWGLENVWEWGQTIGDSWRISGDITDYFETVPNPDGNQQSVLQILETIAPIADFSGDNGFNDADMLEVGNGRMSYEEYKTHFSLWAALKSPLLIGTDLTKISERDLSILKNEHVLEVNQDRLRKSVTRKIKTAKYQVWSGPLEGGRTTILIVNVSKSKIKISLDLGLFGLCRGTLFDVWTEQTLSAIQDLEIEVHDTFMAILRCPFLQVQESDSII
ncbi:alpha-galactosidase-like protein [Gorgonomyces haynaldii]|nr:alpha-galactosidase-like protein [Gorgonomyces haynaldii]